MGAAPAHVVERAVERPCGRDEVEASVGAGTDHDGLGISPSGVRSQQESVRVEAGYVGRHQHDRPSRIALAGRSEGFAYPLAEGRAALVDTSNVAASEARQTAAAAGCGELDIEASGSTGLKQPLEAAQTHLALERSQAAGQEPSPVDGRIGRQTEDEEGGSVGSRN